MRKIVQPFNRSKALEVTYRKKLFAMLNEVLRAVREDIFEPLKTVGEDEVLTSDATPEAIANAFDGMYARFARFGAIGRFAKNLAGEVVGSAVRLSKEDFRNKVSKAIGVDLESVLAQENLNDFVSVQAQKNAGLISTIPTEFIGDVERIVMNGLTEGRTYRDIVHDIVGVDASVLSKFRGRLRTIARNETSTLIAQLDKERSERLGIKRGIYITSGDESVRPCHRELNREEFDLSKGAWSKTCGKFIFPGITDINCRCTFSPIIDL